MSDRLSNRPSLPLNQHEQMNNGKREDDDHEHTRSSSNPGVYKTLFCNRNVGRGDSITAIRSLSLDNYETKFEIYFFV
jgi:hypothetical protein